MTKTKFNLRNVVAIAICLTVTASIFFSCDSLSKEKQIISFNFALPPAVGVINEKAKTVTVTVPANTNVTALTPVITLSSLATISPASGVAQNFTSPVTYTVTAENGSTAKYIVTVIKSGDNGEEEWFNCERGAIKIIGNHGENQIYTFANSNELLRTDEFTTACHVVCIYDFVNKIMHSGGTCVDPPYWVSTPLQVPQLPVLFGIDESLMKEYCQDYTVEIAGKTCKVFIFTNPAGNEMMYATWKGVIMKITENGVAPWTVVAATLDVPDAAFTQTFNVTWL